MLGLLLNQVQMLIISAAPTINIIPAIKNEIKTASNANGNCPVQSVYSCWFIGQYQGVSISTVCCMPCCNNPQPLVEVVDAAAMCIKIVENNIMINPNIRTIFCL